MRTKKLLITMASLLFLFLPVQAQEPEGWGGETEVTVDGKGEREVSNYLVHEAKKWNFMARHFWVKHHVNRGEFAVGPTFKIRGVTLKTQMGGTTDKEVMLAGTVIVHIAHRELTYTADAKIATTKGHSTLFQKGSAAVNKTGSLQVRGELLKPMGEPLELVYMVIAPRIVFCYHYHVKKNIFIKIK